MHIRRLCSAPVDLLRHLRFFEAVADARHFGHAADDLGITQPPLSQGIQRLERHLGVRLFDRDARGVRITTAGERLLPPARELLRSATAVERLATELAGPPRFRVGLCADVDSQIEPVCRELLAAGIGAAPDVAGSRELVDALHAGRLDVAVLRHPGAIDGLVAGEVCRIETELEIAASMSDPSVPRLRHLELPIVVPPRHHQPPAHDQLVDALRRAGHSGAVIESDDPVQRSALVAAGAAAALRPTAAGSAESGHGDLPPLRVRVLLPPTRLRRPDLDHEEVAALTAGLVG